MQLRIDLRSDTVTRPTEAMRQFMLSADVGDDVYGDDPSVAALEAEVASLLGKEAALFVPSGTMANQIALNIHTSPGDSVLIERDSHCALFEAGAAAFLSGVQFSVLPDAGSAVERIQSALLPEGMHFPSSRLLVLENTHNRRGGRALGSSELTPLLRAAKDAGLRTHCDGARIWNAAVATGEPEKVLARDFDTIAVCFSKGLGAPVGSALCGPADLMEKVAKKVRKRLGGAMRQAGVLAAGALYALRVHRSELLVDHQKADLLFDVLESLRAQGAILELLRPTAATNLVYWRVSFAAVESWLHALTEQGVLVQHLGGGWIRAVTHRDVEEAEVRQAAERIAQVGQEIDSKNSE